MIQIQITADVDGIEAVTMFDIENLKWLPLHAPYEIKDDTLPGPIREISFCGKKRQVTQRIIDFVIRVDR